MRIFISTIFFFVLTSCTNQDINTHTKSDSDKKDKTDQDFSKVILVDSFTMKRDSFKILLDREAVILDSLESIQKKSKNKNPGLEKRIAEEEKRYTYLLTKVEENTLSY